MWISFFFLIHSNAFRKTWKNCFQNQIVRGSYQDILIFSNSFKVNRYSKKFNHLALTDIPRHYKNLINYHLTVWSYLFFVFSFTWFNFLLFGWWGSFSWFRFYWSLSKQRKGKMVKWTNERKKQAIQRWKEEKNKRTNELNERTERTEQTNERRNERTKERTKERTNERTNERTERTNE